MNPTTSKHALAVAISAGLAASASAQVFITEVVENPAGDDENFEYIEIYGCPGTSLDGYAIGQLKGGLDGNGDDIPDGSGGDNIPEIDEAYSLDGLTIGANGFLVLYNDGDNNSFIPFLAPPAANIVPFSAAHIPGGGSAGNLNDDGSSTYVLVRTRDNPANFRKEILHDADFDGNADFGTETPPFFGGATPLPVQPFQRVDELAWSNGGGKEYVADSNSEIADTPGFNPDAASRVEYYIVNPNRGSRSRDNGMGGFEIVSTRIADESFVYGETNRLPGNTFVYDTTTDPDGNPQTKGPTDLTATPFDGSCDPEPNNPGPDPACTPNPAGAFLFTDINLTGFPLTPGAHNDGTSVFQFRLACVQSAGFPTGFNARVFPTGDFDFDADVDADDLALIQARLGATLDDRTPNTDPSGTAFNDFAWQNAAFQQVHAMRNMNQTDGPGGTNATAITQADIDALTALLPCPGDTDGDNAVTPLDISNVLGAFGSTGLTPFTNGDVTGDGQVTPLDISTVLGAFGTTCP